MPNEFLEGVLAENGFGREARRKAKGFDCRRMIELFYKYRINLNAYNYALVTQMHEFINGTLDKPSARFLPAEQNEIYEKMAAILDNAFSDDMNYDAPNDRYPAQENVVNATNMMGELGQFESRLGDNMRLRDAKTKTVRNFADQLVALTSDMSSIPSAMRIVADARKTVADKSKNVALDTVKPEEKAYRTSNDYKAFLSTCNDKLKSDIPAEKKDIVSKCLATAQRLATMEVLSDEEHKNRYLRILRNIVQGVDNPGLDFWKEIEYSEQSFKNTSKGLEKGIEIYKKRDQALLKSYIKATSKEEGKALDKALAQIRTTEGKVLDSVNRSLGEIAVAARAVTAVEYQTRRQAEKALKNRIDQVDKTDADYAKTMAGVRGYLRNLRELMPDPQLAEKQEITRYLQTYRDTMRNTFLQRVNDLMDNYQDMRASIHADKETFDRKHKKLEISLMSVMESVSGHMEFAEKLTNQKGSFEKHFGELRGQFMELLGKLSAEKRKRDQIYSRQENALKQSMRSYQDEREKILGEMPEDKDSMDAKILQDELDRHYGDRLRNGGTFEEDYNRETEIRRQAGQFLKAAESNDFSELIDRQFESRSGEEPESCKRALETIFSDEKMRSAYAAELLRRRTRDRVALSKEAAGLKEAVRQKTYGEIGVLEGDDRAVSTLANIIAETYHDDLMARKDKNALSPKRYDELFKAVPDPKPDEAQAEKELLDTVHADDAGTYAASLNEDEEVRRNTTAKIVQEGVSITVDPEFLEKRRQEAVRKAYEEELAQTIGSRLEKRELYDLAMALDQEQNARTNDQDRDAGLKSESFEAFRKDLEEKIANDPALKQDFDKAQHEYFVRRDYSAQLGQELGAVREDPAALAENIFSRRTALGVSEAADDRIREDVLARYEQDCRKVMTPEQDQQYGQVYHRLTKQAEYMDRLQKSFAENRPEAYEAEAAAIRKDNGQDAALAGDVAENCVKNFEENLSGDRKKILEEYRAEMRRQQELRDKTQGRLSEAAGRSMREYCDEEERIRAAAQEPEKEIDKAILTEETAKAYDANIRNKGRENEYADEQKIRKETAEYLESAKRNDFDKLIGSTAGKEKAAYPESSKRALTAIKADEDLSRAYDAELLRRHQERIRAGYEEELRQNLGADKSAEELAKGIMDRRASLQGSDEADDRLRKEVLDRYEKEIAGGRQKEYDDAYYRLTKQAETSERLKKSFAQNDPAAYEKEAAAFVKEAEKDPVLGRGFAEDCIRSFENGLAGLQKEALRTYRVERAEREKKAQLERGNRERLRQEKDAILARAREQKRQNINNEVPVQPGNGPQNNIQGQPAIRNIEDFYSPKMNYIMGADNELKDLADMFLTKKTSFLFINTDTNYYTEAKDALQEYLAEREQIRDGIRSMHGNYAQGNMNDNEFQDYVRTAEQTLAGTEQKFRDKMRAYYVHATKGSVREDRLGNERIDTKTQAAGAARFAASKGFMEFLDAAQNAGNPQHQPVNDEQHIREVDFRQLFKNRFNELNGNGQEANENAKSRNRADAADRAQSTMKRRRWQHQNENGSGPVQNQH